MKTFQRNSCLALLVVVAGLAHVASAQSKAGALKSILGLIARSSRLAANESLIAETGTLLHWTSTEGSIGITKSQSIIGDDGIWAFKSDAPLSKCPLLCKLALGLPRSKTVAVVAVPCCHANRFERVLPLGPYSTLKFLGGACYADCGALGFDGSILPRQSLVHPAVFAYGPDALVCATGAVGGVCYWKLSRQ